MGKSTASDRFAATPAANYVFCDNRLRQCASVNQYRLFSWIAGLCLLAVAGVAMASDKPLSVVVYGGTGNVGQRIVAEALSRGDRVKVISRNAKLPADAPKGLMSVSGDILDTDDVVRQIKGWNVVVNAANVRGQGDDFPLRTAQSLVKALRSLGSTAPLLIVVGGAGSLTTAPGQTMIDQMRSQGRTVLPGILAKADELSYYRTIQDVRWVYLSPSREFAPGQRTGKFRLGEDELVTDKDGNSRISYEDFAVATINEAENPTHVRRRFTIGY